jgi:hypothetical protein
MAYLILFTPGLKASVSPSSSTPEPIVLDEFKSARFYKPTVRARAFFFPRLTRACALKSTEMSQLLCFVGVSYVEWLTARSR